MRVVILENSSVASLSVDNDIFLCFVDRLYRQNTMKTAISFALHMKKKFSEEYRHSKKAPNNFPFGTAEEKGIVSDAVQEKYKIVELQVFK